MSPPVIIDTFWLLLNTEALSCEQYMADIVKYSFGFDFNFFLNGPCAVD